MENNTLKTYAERISRLEAQKAEIASDIKDLYTEAGATGFDKKALKRAIKIASMNAEARRKQKEEDEVLGVYLQQLDLLEG